VPPGTGVKRCAIYLRVSTEMQVDRNSLSTQKSQLLSHAELQGWQVVKIFTDAGLSARDTCRPALQEMLRWAKEGKLDIILVSKMDRISRNQRDFLNLINDLENWDVAFVSASQAIDTSTPAGMLLRNVLASFGQFEREITAERVRENMHHRAKSGAWSGGITPFGYSWNSEIGKLVIVPAEAETVLAIFDMYRQSRSVRRTIHTMNAAGRFNRKGKPWARTSIRSILANRIYVGTMCYAKRVVRGSRIIKQDREKWIVVDKACEPIIEQTIFDDVQKSLNANTRPAPWSDASPHLLTGLARCGLCGGSMTGMNCKASNGNPHRYYRCTARLHKGPSVCKGLICRADELEAAVVGQITGFDAGTLARELEEYKKRMADEAAPRAARRARLQTAFEGYRERERRLLELYETSAIDLVAFRERYAHLDQERAAIVADLAEIDANTPEGGVQNVDAHALAERFRELQATFPRLSLSERQRLLRAMTREVTVYPDGKVKIDFNFFSGLQSPGIPIGQYVEVQSRGQEG